MKLTNRIVIRMLVVSLILNDGKDILFRSSTGWGHYYHYDGNGKLKNIDDFR